MADSLKKKKLEGQVNFRSLGDCVQKGDHIGFLSSYMQLVIAGKELVVPTSLERNIIRGSWERILIGVDGGDDPSFLDKLTLLWVNVMQRQGGNITETFAREVLAILENDSQYLTKVKEEAQKKSGKTSNTRATSNKKPEYRPVMKSIQPEPVSEKERSYRRSPKLETVQSDISKTYYDDANIDALPLKETDALAKVMKETISKGVVDNFLIAYLSTQVQSPRSKIPMTSVLDIGFHKWKELLLKSLNSIPDEGFVRALSERWYYLINHFGLPTDRKKIKHLIAYLQNNSNNTDSNKVEQKKKKDGLWGTISDIFI